MWWTGTAAPGSEHMPSRCRSTSSPSSPISCDLVLAIEAGDVELCVLLPVVEVSTPQAWIGDYYSTTLLSVARVRHAVLATDNSLVQMKILSSCK